MDPFPFDAAALGIDADPYAQLAELREYSPVAPIGSGFWAITGYSAAVDVLRSQTCISSPIALRYLAGLPEGAARDEMGHRINFLDPPDHPRVRSLVNKAFTPRRIADLLPWIEHTARSMLHDLGGRAEVDLLREFGHQVPSLVISEMLGVPPADREFLTDLSDRVAPLLGVELSSADRDAALIAAEDMRTYFDALVIDRRDNPGGDLLSALIEAEESGARLTRPELLSLVATLYSAGHRTTRDLFTNGLSVLLGDPDRYAALADGRWEVATVVAEMLRYETPTLYVACIPVEPLLLDEVEVPAGAPIIVYLAGANRDPDVYASPDSFEPGRSGPVPLSFAFGADYCLGASLARAEVEVMLTVVGRHWPELRPAVDGGCHWHQRGPFRGLDELWVRPGG